MTVRNPLLMALVPLLLAATAAAARADPPPWAPAHGERAHHEHEHRYVYYPDGEVYYAPARHLWFWMSGNGWQAGAQLPLALRAYVRVGGVDIQLGAARPYRRHAYVVRRYGGRRVHWERREHREYRHERREHRGDDDRRHDGGDDDGD